MIKRLLVALGGTPFSHVALRYGVELARAHGASLVGVTFLDTQYWEARLGPLMTASTAARLLEARPWAVAERRVEKVVEGFERACTEAGVAYEVVRQPDRRPVEVLTSAWRLCDMVVFGLRGLFDHTLVPEPETTIAQLTRRGVCPILAVAREYRQVRRVLVAYSGSPESANTMKQYVHMQPWPGAALNVACFGKNPDDGAQLLTEAMDYCRAHGLSVTTEAVEGPARDRLNPYAQAIGADLVVLGDSFRSVFVRDLLGDTMSHLIQTADRPLFLSH